MPTPPPWIERELECIDHGLGLEWDHDREAYWLISRRGNEVVPYGLFEHKDVNQLLLDSVRAGLRLRDRGVSIKDRLAQKMAQRDAESEVGWGELSDFHSAQAQREVDAANVGGKIHAQGSKVPVIGNREEGVLGTD